MKKRCCTSFVLAVTALIISSCRSDGGNSDYLHLITEMHKIECNALSDAGVTYTVNSENIYEFRSIAFDKIMTRPDAKLIAHWEELNHELAVIEHYLDDNGKDKFSSDFRDVYLKPCK